MSMQDKKQQVMDSIRQIAESALTGSETKVIAANRYDLIVAANDHVDYDELYEFECRVDRLSQND